VPGDLADRCSGWSGKITVTVESKEYYPPVTTLTCIVNQAALKEIFRHIYSLGLPLISIIWVEAK